jgi:Rrf2 family protein
MRLSTKGRYAVRAMLELALTQTQNPVTREYIADQQDLSAHYLAQLFLRLRKAGVIHSVKGPKGGYALARQPAEISVGEIIRAVDEPLMPVACVDLVDAKDCSRAPLCATRLLWQQLGQQITAFVDSVTLSDLCEWDESLRDSTPSVVSR